MGAKVLGLALPPTTSPSLYELANVGSVVDEVFGRYQGCGIHLPSNRRVGARCYFSPGCQSLVRESYEEMYCAVGRRQ